MLSPSVCAEEVMPDEVILREIELPTCLECGKTINASQPRYRTPDGDVDVRCYEHGGWSFVTTRVLPLLELDRAPVPAMSGARASRIACLRLAAADSSREGIACPPSWPRVYQWRRRPARGLLLVDSSCHAPASPRHRSAECAVTMRVSLHSLTPPLRPVAGGRPEDRRPESPP